MMCPRFKVITAIGVLLAAYFASVGIGVYRLTSSEPYLLAKKALAERIPVCREITFRFFPHEILALRGSAASTYALAAADPFHLKWFAPWQYLAGSAKGQSQFLLCTVNDHCYPIKAVKENGVWGLDWNIKEEFAGQSR